MGLPFSLSNSFAKVLSLHRSSSSFATAFYCRYGDMRKEIGFKIRDMWYNLGEFQLQNDLSSGSQAGLQTLSSLMKAAGG